MDKAIFTFKVDKDNWDDVDISRLASGLLYQRDFRDFLLENRGKELKAEFSGAGKQNLKHSMYGYYHEVVLGVAIEVFRNEGWESMDKVKADHFLKMECAKGLIYNVKLDRTEIFLEEKSKMSAERLHRYISDCIVYLEVEKGARVPDAESYKFENKTGLIGFKKV